MSAHKAVVRHDGPGDVERRIEQIRQVRFEPVVAVGVVNLRVDDHDRGRRSATGATDQGDGGGGLGRVGLARTWKKEERRKKRR